MLVHTHCTPITSLSFLYSRMKEDDGRKVVSTESNQLTDLVY